MSRGAAATLLCVALAGCADGRSVVTLSISAAASVAGVDHLTVVATDRGRGKSSQPVNVAVPAHTLPPAVTTSFALPKSVRGSVGFTINALAADGTVVASGTTDVTVAPSRTFNASVMLTAAAPPKRHLAFTMQPSGAKPTQPFVVAVATVDDSGTPVAGVAPTVTLSMSGGAANAVLSGVLTADVSSGSATFPGLSINLAGTGYTLKATAAMLDPATSNSFDITPDVWVPVNTGLDGGTMSGACADPSNPDVVWAVTGLGGGLWRTGDGGANWSEYSGPMRGTPFFSCAVSAQMSSRIYVTTNMNGHYLLRSDDNGASWKPLGNGIAVNSLKLLLDPTNDQIVYAYSGAGLFKSTDGGANFTSLSTQVFGRLVVDPTAPATIYATTGPTAPTMTVQKSVDGGAHFAVANSGLPTTSQAVGLAIDPSAPMTLYVSYNAALYKTTNGGSGWTMRATGSFGALAVDPTSSSTLFGITVTAGVQSGVRSADGGATWQPMSGLGTIAGGSGTLFTNSLGVPWYVPNLSSPYKAADKMTWALASHGLGATSIIALATNAQSTFNVFATSYQNAVYRSSASGSTWQLANSGLGAWQNFGFPLVFVGARVYMLGDRLYRFMDPTGPWTAIDAALTSGVSTFDADRGTGSTLLVVDNVNAVWKSTDFGATWATTGATIPFAASTFAGQLLFAPHSSSVAYVAGGGQLFKTSNGGSAFIEVSPLPSRPTIYALTIDPVTDATLYVSNTTPQLWKSNDAATTWTQIGMGLPSGTSNAVLQIVIDPSTPTTVYAATANGDLYKSTDGGANFAKITAPPQMQVLAHDPNLTGRLLAGTALGMYRTVTGGQ